MRRWTLMLCLALVAAFLISLTGCNPAPDPSTTPTQPSTPTPTPSPIPDPSGDPIDQTTTPAGPAQETPDVQSLLSTFFVTHIYYDGRLDTPTPVALDLTITRSAEGQQSVSMNMGHIDSLFYYELNYQDPENTFAIECLDPEQSLYFIDAHIHCVDPRYSVPLQFILDLDDELILFRSRAVPVYVYTVASANPATDPYDILEQLLPHLQQKFPAWTEEPMYPIPERAEQHFCYDLTGTWLDADAQALGQMNFRLVGNVTDNVYWDGHLERNLTFLWPEDFGYENAEPVSHSITLTQQDNGRNFHGIGLLRSTDTGELTTFSFNIFPEDEIVILEMDGKFLVSSTRSDLDAAATLTAYRDWLQHYATQAIDWEMTAFMLNADGAVIDTDAISITGYIWNHSEQYSYLVLDIDFPEGFRYGTVIPQPYGEILFNGMSDDPNDYIGASYCFDGVLNSSCYHYLGFNTEYEYYFGNWEQGDVRYLVAATDPNATADEILAHFWYFLEHNGYHN